MVSAETGSKVTSFCWSMQAWRTRAKLARFVLAFHIGPASGAGVGVGTTGGLSCCGGCKNDSPTAQGSGEATDRFTVTHPFHPLFGQQFDLVQVHHSWHEDRVHFRVGDGGRVESLPLSWTSLACPDPFRERSAGRALFRVEDLLCLVTLAQAMRHPLGEGGVDDV